MYAVIKIRLINIQEDQFDEGKKTVDKKYLKFSAFHVINLTSLSVLLLIFGSHGTTLARNNLPSYPSHTGEKKWPGIQRLCMCQVPLAICVQLVLHCTKMGEID